MIKFYFQSKNKINIEKIRISFKRNPTKAIYYRFYLYNALFRKLLFEHFTKYYLIGKKIILYKIF